MVFLQADHPSTLQVGSSDGDVPSQPPPPPFPQLPPLPPLPPLTQPTTENSAGVQPSQPPSLDAEKEQSRKRRQSEAETTSDSDNQSTSSGVGSIDLITSVTGQGHSNPGAQVGHHPPPLPHPPAHFHPSPDTELNNENNSHLNPIVGVEETSTQGFVESTTSSSSFS